MSEVIQSQSEKIYKVYRDTIRINVKELNTEYVKTIKTIYKDAENNTWIVITLYKVA